MIRKSFAKHCAHIDGSNQCIIHTKSRPETFSSFVSKVINNTPVTVATKHLPLDANNPIEVLKSKGLLNFPLNATLHDDCSSDVSLNFYSEELRCKEPVKIFASNHHFKHGKLVSSSTHEWIPDLTTEIEKFVEWETEKQSRTMSDVNLRTSSQTACKKSVRKALTDLLRDVERQRIIRQYESGARRRPFRCRSLSPIHPSDIENKNSERYLHTLRSKYVERSVSPKRFGVSCKSRREPFRCPDQIIPKSSSEISIRSKESWFHYSPKKQIEETTKFDKQYRYKRISPPRPKITQDLFVIPDHTCRKVPCADSYRSRWNIKSNFVTSSSKKSDKERDASSSFQTEGYSHRIMRNSADKYLDRAARARDQTSERKSPLKGILNNTKYEKNSKVSPPHQKLRFREDVTKNNNKVKLCRERDDHSSETDSDSSSRTKMFSPPRDLVNEKDKTYNEYSSDSSATSIYSVHHSDPKGYNRAMDEKHRAGDRKKYYKDYKEQTYESSEASRIRGIESKRPVKVEPCLVREESKDKKKRRQINPNSVVHIEDNGKRLSQHYSDEKVTLDSEKAFADEEMIKSKKIALHNYSPKRSNTTKEYREESLEDFLRRVLHEDHKNSLNLIENAINREALAEYRRKYVNDSTKKNGLRSIETRHYDEYETINHRQCDSEDCEACIIERLHGER